MSITLGGVILSAVITALVMELVQTTPWLADKLMQWSVRVRYADNPQRAEVRREELIGILEGLPRLFKLPTACWFFLSAVAYRFQQGWGTAPGGQLLKLRARRHWACLLSVLAETLGIVIAAFLLSQIVNRVGNDLWLLQSLLFWSIVVVAVLRLAWKVLNWWMLVVVVTDKQFMIISGVTTRKIYLMPLVKLTDLSLMRPVAGQVLGYGTLRVEAAGQKQDLATIKFLPRPEEVFVTISELIFVGDKQLPHS
ncbi:MAG TPA: PH domain-containing protein [Pseudonocardiaceae bacterium]|nr:PH domain-containing protein [Pseudonocardiaceae bacterium]